jgi:hypothetical protein
VLVKAKPSDVKQAVRHLPQRPRDLNAPVIVRNYIDPWEAQRSYDARHRRKGALGTVDRAIDRE